MNTTSSYWNIGFLNPGQTYQFTTIMARDSSGTSKLYGTSWSFTMPSNPIAWTPNCTVAKVSGSIYRVTWNSATGGTGTITYSGTFSGGSPSTMSTTSTYWNISYLSSGGTYTLNGANARDSLGVSTGGICSFKVP